MQTLPSELLAIVLETFSYTITRKENKTMRKEMVTRGIDGTKATIKVIDTTTDMISTREVVLSKDYKDDEKKLNKAVVKTLGENEVLIRIEKSEVVHKLVGMDMAQFLALAVELDPETRKVISTPNATAIAD